MEEKCCTKCLSLKIENVANQSLDILEFLQLQASGIPVLDVRTPAEFASGHIPGALNLPLFDDEERKIIGTIYKQVSREKAILQGLELVGPRMADLAKQGISHAVEKKVLVHCWRGGMRSSSLAWLLNLMGIETLTLRRGYKNFRKYVLQTFTHPYQFTILGGKTGSAKTRFLAELQKRGEQMIDLEGLAFHRGSAFGAIGQSQRQTQEQFENELAVKLRAFDPDKTIWIEDESRHVGSKIIPMEIWENMRHSRVLFLDFAQDVRIEYLKEEYGQIQNMEFLKKAFFDIKKRLGDVSYNDAIKALDSNDLTSACKIALDYYDKAYEYGLSKRDQYTIQKIKLDNLNIEFAVNQILMEKSCQI